ncbi:hypothetical protein PIB30_062084 [Stylosanthes scabra]|uniref:Uncharacterized protein n=1 Tax=Stylosanthes scabra TaxID=79078 RepID=A0ABU6YLJ6_9FABA|nr:hypothetical protein [Stylosanthes scabra]
MFSTAKRQNGEKDEDENEEGSVSWWYNLLVQLVDSDDEEDDEREDKSEEEDEDESAEEDSNGESAEEEDQTEEEESEDEKEVYNKRTSFIATLFNNKEIKEEVPIKYEDPGPCLVTCKIKGVEIRELLGIAENILVKIGELVIPADFHVIKSTKREKGGTPQVLLGRPFLKTVGFKLIYYDEIFTFEMVHTKSNPLAKGKTKAHRLPLQASPRLAALRSRGKVQPQPQAPDIPTENIPMSILPPKKRLTYRMAGEGSSRKGTKLPCRRSQQIVALHRAKSKASGEHEVIALSSDSEHEKNENLEANAEGALPAAEGGAEEILPKNDVYDALWAMLDAESENEAEEIPSQWDLNSVLNNWEKVEANMGPAGNDQGPPPAAN